MRRGGGAAVTLGFECRSNNTLTRFKEFFVGQCQNPSSRSRAKSLVVVTAEVRGAPGPHSSQLLLSGALDHRGFCSADSAVRAARGRGMQMWDATVRASAARGVQ